MQERVKDVASVLLTQVDSLIKTAELTRPKAFPELKEAEEKVTPIIREKYASTCSEVQSQLRRVLSQVREKSPDPEIEAKLTQAIDHLEELKKPYV